MEKAGEHGPGVGGSIGRLTRVRPLLRFEADFSPKGHCERHRRVAIPHIRWGFPRSLRSLGMTEKDLLRTKVVPRFIRPCSARAIFYTY